MYFTESPYNSTPTRDRYFNCVVGHHEVRVYISLSRVTTFFGAFLNVSLEIKQIVLPHLPHNYHNREYALLFLDSEINI